MAAPSLDFRNTNSLWGSVLVETLVRLGVTKAVIAPGSRSAPLAFAFAGHAAIEAIPVLDERSAGSFALGLAKRRGEPVALVCTSGTAAANFLPAVIEAWHSSVPLIVLTADRPPELRQCSAGQTIDQQKLYGNFVNFHHELAVPEPTLEALRYLRQTVAHAVERASWPIRGPVHLNAPFRDPLPPIADGRTAGLRRAVRWGTFFSELVAGPAPVLEEECPEIPPSERGLIVAGPDAAREPRQHAGIVLRLARSLGWPVLADGLSSLRSLAGGDDLVVTAYDAILRNPALARRLRPERVVVFGDWPISKVLRGWLEELEVPIWFVSTQARNPDALHGHTRWLRVTPAAVLRSAMARRAAGVPAYATEWARAERKARSGLSRAAARSAGMFEGRATALLAEHLPEGTPVFVASSMPVRDFEYFRPAGTRGLQPFFNRGANGIDGTLSAALGVAHGGKPTVLLTGDLALLHDTNGFLVAAELRGSLTIVLINNSGGGIFEHLPVSQFPEAFERFFATPQKVDFARLARAYGIGHARVRSWAQFTKLIAKLPRRGVRILEIVTDRRRDAAFRKKTFSAVAAKLE